VFTLFSFLYWLPSSLPYAFDWETFLIYLCGECQTAGAYEVHMEEGPNACQTYLLVVHSILLVYQKRQSILLLIQHLTLEDIDILLV